jgi:subtilisin family serine protease
MGDARITRRLAGLGMAATAALALAVTAASPASAEGQILGANRADAVKDSYIVALNQNVLSAQSAGSLAQRYGGQVKATWTHALNGFHASMSAAQARRLAADPSVAYVQQDAVIKLATVQTPVPSWGLDRIDQQSLPLDNSYTYNTTASNVHAYIIDTGVRTTHTTFGGRATWGTNTTGDANNTDCNGHGTHVAGNVGGAEYGVAKGVSIVAVKVLDCAGSGTTAGVVAGIDWVTANAIKPAVANMSLGGGVDTTLDNAVTNSIASGVSYAVASGNSNADACNYSPARTPTAITVNASDSSDVRASFSNYGTCTSIFAPGVNITSSWNTNDTATNTISGTSMATPHVTGAAALYLATNPTASPATVKTALVNAATPNKITSPGTGSPNKLLFTGTTAPGTPSVTNPGNQVSTVGTAASLQLSASGGTSPYTWTATGLPAGLSISSSGLISGTPTTTGTSSVTATAKDAASKTASTTFSWTVNPAGSGCAPVTNSTPVTIPDLGDVSSSITLSCSGNASATTKVTVNITHTYIGDLIVDLVAPDSTVYNLHNRTGGSTQNINKTYTVNASSELAAGTWKLRVRDMASLDSGRIDSWTLAV